MEQSASNTKVFHVDWETKRLVSVEILENFTAPMPEQGKLFEQIFSSGDTVLTVFATKHPHNNLPDIVRQSELATLKWNNKYSIPDFGYDESGVYGNLSFNSKQHFVYLSWGSIVEMTGLTSQVSAVWPENGKGEIPE